MEELFVAIKAGDAERVRALVAGDPALAAARDEAGLSAVLTARYHRQDEALESLLAAEPELDDRDAAKALLEAGADPNCVQQGGFTPLLAAAHADDAEMAALLLRHGADRGLAADDGRDPAAMAGPRVSALLQR